LPPSIQLQNLTVEEETLERLKNLYSMRDDLIKNHLKKIGNYMALQKEISQLRISSHSEEEISVIQGATQQSPDLKLSDLGS